MQHVDTQCFYVTVEDLDLDRYACTVSTLPPEPSP